MVEKSSFSVIAALYITSKLSVELKRDWVSAVNSSEELL